MNDLTKGNPLKVLIKYILPLLGSIVFQQIYNIADSIIAGKFIGENALAAVGNSYEITLLFLAFATGCNIGASILTAKNYGSKNYKGVKTGISTSFITTFIVCSVLMIIGFVFAKPLLIVLNTPLEILNDSLTYVYIYVGGLYFLFFYNLCTGIFASLGDSKTPFIFLVASSLANVGMDILFVVVFKMGVAGVAWATFICQGVSCALSLITLFVQIKKIKVDEKIKKFSFESLKNFLTVGIPSTLQQSFVSVGNIILQSLINSFGPSTIAGYSAGVKAINFAITCLVMVGTSISNYTAQNLAVHDIKRVKQGFKYGLIITSFVTLIFTLPYFLLSDKLIMLFLKDKTSDALTVGSKFITVVSPFFIIVAFKLVGDGVIRGAEKMSLFMITTLTDLILRVSLSFVLARNTSLGSTGIWWSWPIGWAVATAMSLCFYFSNIWQRNRKV